MAEAISKDRMTLSKWERGASDLDAVDALALARFFGVSVGWLIGGEGPPPPISVDLSPTGT